MHRSHAIHRDAVDQIISWSNGRLLCQMKDGQQINTNRSDAQRLRELVLG